MRIRFVRIVGIIIRRRAIRVMIARAMRIINIRQSDFVRVLYLGLGSAQLVLFRNLHLSVALKSRKMHISASSFLHLPLRSSFRASLAA